jgi:ribose transport system ATP-binding protein
MMPLLRATGITKAFPGVQALRGIDFDVTAGEVHALIGENGAGKSTFMQILAGSVKPDSGNVFLEGTRLHPGSRKDSERLGIAMVYQERSLFPDLSVAENVFSSRQPRTALGLLNRNEMLTRSRHLLSSLSLDVDPRVPLSLLSPAQQQLVEIAKALALDARLLILDEPTACLSEPEREALFAVVRRLRERMVGIIYVSHRLDEVLRISDRITVFRDGANQGTLFGGSAKTEDLIRLMVGRTLEFESHENPHRAAGAPVALDVRGLSDDCIVRDVTFQVFAGEIVALAGLAGAGRTETALAIFGASRKRKGEVRVFGELLAASTPAAAIAAGIGYVSEDRRDSGLFLDMGMTANVVAVQTERFGRWWFSDKLAGECSVAFQTSFRIAAPDLETPVGCFSGGNQQKVALSKWLRLNPRVLIADEPTRGIDIAAKAEVHRILQAFARAGNAVLLISSDLPEVLALADRVLVMRQGRVESELTRQNATEREIIRRATTGN